MLIFGIILFLVAIMMKGLQEYLIH